MQWVIDAMQLQHRQRPHSGPAAAEAVTACCQDFGLSRPLYSLPQKTLKRLCWQCHAEPALKASAARLCQFELLVLHLAVAAAAAAALYCLM